MRSIEMEVVYPHPPERVWRALTDPAAIAAWLMPNDFTPKIGHKFQFRTKPAPGFDGIVNCEVLELDAPRRLVYSWNGGGISTTVTWVLEPVAGGTRVRFEHAGFEGLRGYFVRSILAKGWTSSIIPKALLGVLAQLRDGVAFEAKGGCGKREGEQVSGVRSQASAS